MIYQNTDDILYQTESFPRRLPGDKTGFDSDIRIRRHDPSQVGKRCESGEPRDSKAGVIGRDFAGAEFRKNFRAWR